MAWLPMVRRMWLRRSLLGTSTGIQGYGDRVIAGAVVHGGTLDVQVTGVGNDTWLARLAAQISEAQTSRASVQDLADKISARFVPAILVLAAITFLGWALHSGAPSLAWRQPSQCWWSPVPAPWGWQPP